MFKTLLKINVQSLFLSMFSNSKEKEKKRKKRSVFIYVLIGLLAVYIVAAVVAGVALMFSPVAKAFGSLPELEWLYFALAGILVFMLTFVGSVFSTQNLIFKAKDNELLLSMPVPTSYILASRVASLLVLDLFYAVLIGAPLIGVYFYHHGFSAEILAVYIVCVLLTVVFSAAVTAFCGWAIALISTKFKKSNVLQIILSLGFFGAYMVFAMNMQTYLEKLLTNGESIAAAVKKAMPVFYWFGTACVNSELKSVALLAVTAIVPFILGCVLISKSFIKIATTKKAENKKKYVARELSASSAKVALLKKEFARFFSMPMYILNSATGSLMLILFAIIITVKGDGMGLEMMFAADPEIAEYLPVIIALAVGFCSSMCNPAASSISLEGSRINVLRSMPVNSDDFYFAKYMVNFIVGFVPTTIAFVFLSVGLGIGFSTLITVYVSAVSFLALTSFINLTANLMMPRFSWQNEMVVIKQGGAVLIAMLSGIASTATAYAPFFLLKKYMDSEIYLLIQSAVCLAICLGFIKFYKTSGRTRFERMNA
ncbi:MAG: hypothetical protein J6J45_06200 [Clostridia bacterium]|nr:hypothetical protein [Clostridia bacterium]